MAMGKPTVTLTVTQTIRTILHQNRIFPVRMSLNITQSPAKE